MDVKYAFRLLVRQPLFTAGAVLTLALGIGVNSTIFTLSNAALLRPMPGVSDPGGLVWLSSVSEGRHTALSYPEYVDYRDGSATLFSDLVAFHVTPVSVAGGGDPQRLRAHLVSGGYFGALAEAPALGRLVGARDESPGGAAVVVLSHHLWRQRFGESPDVLAGSLTINGRSFAIVGVAPEHFVGPVLGEAADLWIPIPLAPDLNAANRAVLVDREAAWLTVLGRLRPEVTAAQAQQALAVVATRHAQDRKESEANRTVAVTSAASGLPPAQRGEVLPLSALLMTISAIVLLITCANLANLLLARGASRSLEMSVRAAVGATRGRLVRQLMVEGTLLGVAGAAAGLLLSFWLTDVLLLQLPEADFRGFHAGADIHVVMFTAALAGLSTCAFGIVPALSATRGALLLRLREGASSGRTRVQGLFVVAQLSLSLVLLLAGGLSLRAVHKARAVDLGFDPSGVVTASYDLALQNYAPERRAAFRRALRQRIAALPGVTAVTLANVPPLSGIMAGTRLSAGAQGSETEMMVFTNAVGAAYFETLRIPIVKGRALDDHDIAASPHVAVVNETLSRRLAIGADPIGTVVTLGDDRVEIVGIARDSNYDEPTEDPVPFLYTSVEQSSALDRETAVARVATSPVPIAGALKEAIHVLDPDLPVFDVRPLDQVLRDRADKERGVSLLLSAFGALALLLAALGVYAVMSFGVARRTREIGIRLALGARPRELSLLVAVDGLKLALAGVAIGSVLALPVAVAVGVLLFGVRIADLAAFAGICLLLVAVAVLASVLPAWRASRINAVAALRTD